MHTLLDLSIPIDEALRIYSEEGYMDPPYQLSEWCSIAEQGYAVQKIEMGTQTATHLDAPSHFARNGKNLEGLPLENMIGAYFFVDLTTAADEQALTIGYKDEKILFLFAGEQGITIKENRMQQLIDLRCPLWVVAGDIEIKDAVQFRFYHLVSAAGIFLVDNLNLNAAKQVTAGGEIMALPLPLTGAFGSPCRVIVKL